MDNVEAFRELDAHAALKKLQLESGICCETVEMDASPVITALLDVAEAVLGAGARMVLAAVLPEIRTIPVNVAHPVNLAQSLAFDSMEEEDFATFFKGIIAWIGDCYAHVHVGRRARGLLADGQWSAAAKGCVVMFLLPKGLP